MIGSFVLRNAKELEMPKLLLLRKITLLSDSLKKKGNILLNTFNPFSFYHQFKTIKNIFCSFDKVASN